MWRLHPACLNIKTLLQNTAPEDNETLLDLSNTDLVKAVGIIWNLTSDIHMKDNPADLVSPGTMPLQLVELKIWFSGLIFLKAANSFWPKQIEVVRSGEKALTKFTFASFVNNTYLIYQ